MTNLEPRALNTELLYRVKAHNSESETINTRIDDVLGRTEDLQSRLNWLRTQSGNLLFRYNDVRKRLDELQSQIYKKK